jgi:hypothetical protein
MPRICGTGDVNGRAEHAIASHAPVVNVAEPAYIRSASHARPNQFSQHSRHRLWAGALTIVLSAPGWHPTSPWHSLIAPQPALPSAGNNRQSRPQPASVPRVPWAPPSAGPGRRPPRVQRSCRFRRMRCAGRSGRSGSITSSLILTYPVRGDSGWRDYARMCPSSWPLAARWPCAPAVRRTA